MSQQENSRTKRQLRLEFQEAHYRKYNQVYLASHTRTVVCPLRGTYRRMKYFFPFFCRNPILMIPRARLTRDFWNSYSVWPRWSNFKHFPLCWACAKISKCWLSLRENWLLAGEHTHKSIRRTTCTFRVFLLCYLCHPFLCNLPSLSDVLCPLSHVSAFPLVLSWFLS